MYEIAVQDEFCAAHAIRIRGEVEPVHGHNWKVTVRVRGEALDEDGLLCDFHEVERVLHHLVDPWRNADLNRSIENPTAEHVARHLGTAIASSLTLPAGARLHSVSVTEAPGCATTWFAPDDG
ncbi:MAG: 6-carboxytetrahydropterin synthase [Phycisphaerales bacterium]|nr:6-carboxytetrahydropterin synthase [Phycisphaerales bacterium]